MSITCNTVAKKEGLERIEIAAVVIRADGRVEDLGVIAEHNFTLKAKIQALINKFRFKGKQ